MKRFLAAILALLYLGTSIQATIQLHYCMGRLVEWTLRHQDNSRCGKCGMEKKPESNSGCCRDEYKNLKVDKDQKLSDNNIQLNEAIDAPVKIPNYSISFSILSHQGFTKVNGPPLKCNTSLNILQCVFRI